VTFKQMTTTGNSFYVHYLNRIWTQNWNQNTGKH